MAQWIPQETINRNEHIGRRLFDEPALVGTQDQGVMPRLDLRNFIEKRDRRVSVDRLGRSGIDKTVATYLLPRARRAAEKFRSPKRFDGWAVLTAHNFGSPPAPPDHALSVTASPENGEGLDENIYHAHITMPERMDSYTMALHLRELFESHGKIERVRNESKHNRLRILFEKFKEWFAQGR